MRAQSVAGQSERVLLLIGALLAITLPHAAAQAPIGNEAYAFGIYHVDYAFYPIIQAYIRTFDQNREPLVNVNVANIGIMVKGRIYDPHKLMTSKEGVQYAIETLESRSESFRTVFVWDCSGTMAGKPFADAQTALMRFIETKRVGDQVAILAIRDEQPGYQIVSSWERDPTLLYQRIRDVKCDGQQTRLYDTIGAAMEMCATASQGDISDQGGEFPILNAIVVLSDGQDDGSAVSREELISRINTLKTPIPVFSVAYSSIDSSNFRNLEAIAKATFGRYWTASESQELSRTVQEIHRINRSDYVVTFRSYEPVDGSQVNFKIGISYPSNTGRFVWQEGVFESIESPAPFHPVADSYYKKLQERFPLTPTGPYADQPTPAAGASAPLAEGAEAETQEAEEEKSLQQRIVDSAKANAGLLAVGLVLILLVTATILWVKRGTGARPYHDGSTAAVGRSDTLRNSGTGANSAATDDSREQHR